MAVEATADCTAITAPEPHKAGDSKNGANVSAWTLNSALPETAAMTHKAGIIMKKTANVRRVHTPPGA